MRKGVVTILAVAIIGTLGIYGKGHANKSESLAGAVQNPPRIAAGQAPQSAVPAGGSKKTTGFNDGTYTGSAADTVYGRVQIAVVVSGGKIIDIQFLQMPNDLGHTQEVTNFSQPLLEQETLIKQSANIDFVSGATQTSEGYQQSCQAALNQAA